MFDLLEVNCVWMYKPYFSCLKASSPSSHLTCFLSAFLSLISFSLIRKVQRDYGITWIYKVHQGKKEVSVIFCTLIALYCKIKNYIQIISLIPCMAYEKHFACQCTVCLLRTYTVRRRNWFKSSICSDAGTSQVHRRRRLPSSVTISRLVFQSRLQLRRQPSTAYSPAERANRGKHPPTHTTQLCLSSFLSFVLSLLLCDHSARHTVK